MNAMIVRLDDKNKTEYEKLLGILSPFTHVVFSKWDAKSGSNSEPKSGWDGCVELKDFEKICEKLNCQRKVVMSGRELAMMLQNKGPLVPSGPGMTKGHAFAALSLA
jgi:hypothetical protein